MDNEEREELRRFLAEEVMGWRPLKGTKRTVWVVTRETGLLYYESEWQPDIRIEQAMLVADKLIAQDWEFSLWHNGNRHAAPWDSRFVNRKDERKRGMSISDKPAEAICRAVKEAWEGGDASEGD